LKVVITRFAREKSFLAKGNLLIEKIVAKNEIPNQVGDDNKDFLNISIT